MEQSRAPTHKAENIIAAIYVTAVANLRPRRLEGRPKIDALVQGTEVQCLYDSGACVSLMSEEAYKRIDYRNRPSRVDGPWLNLVGADSKVLKIRGKFTMHIDIGGRVIKEDVYVIPGLSSDVIIGCDIIRKHTLTWDPATDRIFYQTPNGWQRGDLTCAERTRVPAGGSRAIKVNVSEYPGLRVMRPGEAVAAIFCLDYPVGGNEGIIKINERGEAHVIVDNLLDVDVVLPRNVSVGSVERLDEDGCERLDLDQQDMPKEVGPRPSCRDREKVQMLRETIQEQTQHLSQELRKLYEEIVVLNHDVFSKEKSDLGRTTVAQHTIELRDQEPIYVKQFRLAQEDRSVLISHLRNWLKLGVVSPSRSKYNSPIFLVPKKDGSKRPVLDFREINNKSFIDKYSQMEVQDCIDQIGKAKSKVFSSIDLTSGFWQVPLKKESRPYTAFTIPGLGSFEWNCTPMGLLGSPATFGRMMEYIMRFTRCICYQDDVLIHARNHEEQLKELQTCFNRLRAANLKMNVKKCSFGQASVPYLGFTLTEDGILPGEDKTKAIKECNPPRTVKQVREFIGICNYFRASVKGFADICAPLNDLTKVNCGWRGGELPEQALKAFRKLRDTLTNPPVLAYPDPTLDYHLVVDASIGSETTPGGIGASLIQIKEGVPRAIGYASRKLAKHEKNYSAYLCELAACCFGMEHFEVYLKGRKFYLYTDHKPIEKLSTIHTRTLNRLNLLMGTFQAVIKYKPGKDNNVADFLSRNPISSVDIQRDHLIGLQDKDEYIQDIKARLAQNETRIKEKFGMKYGILFHLDNRGNTIVAPKSLRPEIIQAAHNSLLGGHMGIYKSAERIMERYYWPAMVEDIKDHIRSCLQCQKNKPYRRPEKIPLTPLPQPPAPNHRVHIDLFGPLKASGKGKKYVMCMTDAFSKYVELTAIESKEAAVVAKAFMDTWVTRYSTPREILTDGGKEFANNLLNSLCTELGILHHQTSPYHPQCNAQVEVFNRTMRQYLQNTVGPTLLDWEAALPALRISYNTSVSKATLKTPFSLVFGMKANMPFFDFEETLNYDEKASSDLAILRAARKEAERNNLKYKKEYEKQYNKTNKARQQQIQKGQWVWVENNHKTATNPKLQPLFLGPFQVEEVKKSDIIYLDKSKKKIAHLDRVKVAHLPKSGQLFEKPRRSTAVELEEASPKSQNPRQNKARGELSHKKNIRKTPQHIPMYYSGKDTEDEEVEEDPLPQHIPQQYISKDNADISEDLDYESQGQEKADEDAPLEDEDVLMRTVRDDVDEEHPHEGDQTIWPDSPLPPTPPAVRLKRTLKERRRALIPPEQPRRAPTLRQELLRKKAQEKRKLSGEHAQEMQMMDPRPNKSAKTLSDEDETVLEQSEDSSKEILGSTRHALRSRGRVSDHPLVDQYPLESAAYRKRVYKGQNPEQSSL